MVILNAWLHSMGSWGSLLFFSSRRRHTNLSGDWSSDVCSSDLGPCVQRVGFERTGLLGEGRPQPPLIVGGHGHLEMLEELAGDPTLSRQEVVERACRL